MKNQFALLTFLLVIQISSAQLFTKEKVQNNQNMDKKLLSYGYYFGVNTLDFKFDYNSNKGDLQTEKTAGFNVGLVGDVRINDYINLRLEPGLVISSRNIIYPENYFEGIPDTRPADFLREIKSTYVYVPLLLRLSTKRVNNFKPFITFGIASALNLSSNQDNPEDNSGGEFRSKKSMMFYDIGFGIDFYLYWFKFTPSIRGVFAMNEELVKDVDPNSPWTGNLSSMKTRGVFINFTFR